MEALISAQEAMRVLGVCRAFLTDHRAELGGVKVGRLLKFRRSDLEAYLTRNRVPGAPPTVIEAEPPSSPVRGRIADLFPPDAINPVTKLPWKATA